MKHNIKKAQLLVLLLMFSFNALFSQKYYGQHNFGKLEILNDSVLTVKFVSGFLGDIFDTCLYRKRHDTLFVSSKITKPIDIKTYNNPSIIKSGYPVILKRYMQHKNSYKLIHEYCYGIYDTINNLIVFNDYEVDEQNLIVIKDGPVYFRFVWDNE